MTTRILLTTLLLVFSFNFVNAKSANHPKINNLKGALLVVKNDKFNERFSAEVNVAKIFSPFQMPMLLSVNLIKENAPLTELASSKVQGEMAAKNINSVLIVSVRGYDNRFKPRTKIPETLIEMLEEGNLMPITQDDISSVTIEFFQYVGGKFHGYHMMRVGSASNKQKVYKKMQKKLNRMIPSWRV